MEGEFIFHAIVTLSHIQYNQSITLKWLIISIIRDMGSTSRIYSTKPSL